MSSRAVFASILLFGALRSLAQLSETSAPPIYHPAIKYYDEPLNDPVGALNRKLDEGKSHLIFDGPTGYLRSVLDALDVPIASQIAVFSKTSLQAPRIHPDNPRTIFFNDAVTVAWMRGGFIELASQDPQQGVKFYTLDQRPSERPRFQRGNDCLRCHITDATIGVPGFVIASVSTGPDGTPIESRGATIVDHRTPVQERWGGWYVTGAPATLQHRGNMTIDPRAPAPSALNPVLNVDTLKGKFDTDVYLSARSDVVAQFVFDHQMHMSNLLTRIGWDVRVATWDKDPALKRSLVNSAREVVDYLLFVEEAPINTRVTSSPEFSSVFSASGPRDKRGRSLRDLDLQNRLLRYPCSYMIYSDAFNALPAQAKEAIYQRMWQVLSGSEKGKKYIRVSASDRRAIVEILRDTKDDLPSYFK